MIPTHGSDKIHKKGIIVHHLEQLNEYDFTTPHRHDYFEFFYFKKGGGLHTVDFKEFEIHDNSVHIVAPGQVHQMQRALYSEGYVVLFELTALNPPSAIESFLFEHICMSAEELNPTFRFEVNLKQPLNERIRHVFESYKRAKPLDQLRLMNEMQLFCISCMEHAGEGGKPVESAYLSFRRLLRTHFKINKKVKDYAEKMNITERTLSDLVKQNSGKSVSEVIYTQIVMEAKRLLRTGITIKESAYALNFEDPGHFSKFFKNKTGMSPSDFQNHT